MSDNVEKIVEGVKQGDERYFNILFKKYFRHLHFFATQYVKDSSVAENLVQDTFMTLWRKRAELKSQNEPGLLSWLYTVLKNNCFHHLKRQKAEREFSSSLLEEQVQLDMAGLFEMDTSEHTFNEIYKIIQQTLEELSPQCRRVFEMSRFDGFKNREIAALLNISEKAVEGNITRALKVFRGSLKEYLPQILAFFNI